MKYYIELRSNGFHIITENEFTKICNLMYTGGDNNYKIVKSILFLKQINLILYIPKEITLDTFNLIEKYFTRSNLVINADTIEMY